MKNNEFSPETIVPRSHSTGVRLGSKVGVHSPPVLKSPGDRIWRLPSTVGNCFPCAVVGVGLWPWNKWTYRPTSHKWLIAFGTVVNCHKPVIWEWIESRRFSWFLGCSRMVYDMGFTTLSTIHFGGLVILSQQSPVPSSSSVSPSQLARYQSRHNKREKTGDASVDVLIESTVCSISLKKTKAKKHLPEMLAYTLVSSKRALSCEYMNSNMYHAYEVFAGKCISNLNLRTC